MKNEKYIQLLEELFIKKPKEKKVNLSNEQTQQLFSIIFWNCELVEKWEKETDKEKKMEIFKQGVNQELEKLLGNPQDYIDRLKSICKELEERRK